MEHTLARHPPAPVDAPDSRVLVCRLPVPGTLVPDYWKADAFAAGILAEFEAHRGAGDDVGERRAFFLLARYYGRTLAILRRALSDGATDLIGQALENLVVLHRHLALMRTEAREAVPLVVTLDRPSRQRVLPDLVVAVMDDTSRPMDPAAVADRVNDLHLAARVRVDTIAAAMERLRSEGALAPVAGGRYRRSTRPYRRTNPDREGLRALLGDRLYRVFDAGGFPGLASIRARPEAFRDFFSGFAGCRPALADGFVAAASELTGWGGGDGDDQPWSHADLIGSTYPRPYQRRAFEVYRSHGYDGQVIEAPTGSGKTLVGELCIQDWLATLSPGEAVLVLVPTANYLRQWTAELTTAPAGLRLPLGAVFGGTPAELEAFRGRRGASPAVLVSTYAALAALASPMGKGGFDADSVEAFLQGNGVQYVLLDEVHKVVENERSVTHGVVEVFVDWLRDGSLRGLIGFSGTVEGYRDRIERLGLSLAYTVPVLDLVGAGYIAPYTEFGVPFAHSDRERRVAELVRAYGAGLARYFALLGPGWIRDALGRIPMEGRSAIARDRLGLGAGRPDRDAAIERRFRRWESLERFGVADAAALGVVQIALGLSDEAMIEASVARLAPGQMADRRAAFLELLGELDAIRSELAGLVREDRVVSRLRAEGFGTAAPGPGPGRAALASSIAGLYPTLRGLYHRMGEGRVDAVRAVVRAEASARDLGGAIVFDRATRIRWREPVPDPGYAGVAGLFSGLLDDPDTLPMGVVSGEIYLPRLSEGSPAGAIATFVRDRIMVAELGQNLFDLLTRGLTLPSALESDLREELASRLQEYGAGLAGLTTARPTEFGRRVLTPLRRGVRRARLGRAGDRLLDRLTPRHHLVRQWIGAFFDYALVAHRFDEAREILVRRPDGEYSQCSVVRMDGGERRALFYDLVARVVDARVFPVRVVIVSSWARTGWNVRRPNVLVDATATRDVTAWLQLRGRAMRTSEAWTGEDSARLEALVAGGEDDAAVRLLLDGNKVTHIYELVKAYGSEMQVRRDRRTGLWKRVDAIAAKHAHEGSVDPLSGAYGPGERHAPLVAGDDPREDRPAELGTRLEAVLRDLDARVVRGWLEAVGKAGRDAARSEVS